MTNQGPAGTDHPGHQQHGAAEPPNYFQRFAPHSHVANAVATILLVIVGAYGIYVTNQVVETTERAFVSPVNATLVVPVKNGDPIRFRIIVRNTGKEPALDAAIKIHNSDIGAFDPALTSFTEVPVEENKTCEGLASSPGAYLIPPSGIGENTTVMQMDSIQGTPPYRADDRIEKGQRFYVVMGCLAYRTFGRTHHTGFCYILPVEFIPNIPQPLESFIPCRSGFSAD